MSNLVQAIVAPTGILVPLNEIGVGRDRSDVYWLNYIETDFGFYTTCEENAYLHFFPNKENIGERFPFMVRIGDNDTLQDILENFFDSEEHHIVHIDISG